MINKQNQDLFKTKSTDVQEAADKHSFYYELNRQLASLPDTTKVFYITFRVESILHIVSRELNALGYYTSLETYGEKQVLHLRILLKN